MMVEGQGQKRAASEVEKKDGKEEKNKKGNTVKATKVKTESSSKQPPPTKKSKTNNNTTNTKETTQTNKSPSKYKNKIKKKKTKWQNMRRDRRPPNLRPGGADYKGSVPARDKTRPKKWKTSKQKKEEEEEIPEVSQQELLEGYPSIAFEDSSDEDEYESDPE